MRPFTHRVASLAVAALIGVGALPLAASATEASKSERRANGAFLAGLLLSQHDRNRDQRLEPSEIDTGDMSFDRLDRNDDGYLDVKELRNWNRRYIRKLRRDYRREARLTRGVYNRGYINRMRRRRAD